MTCTFPATTIVLDLYHNHIVPCLYHGTVRKRRRCRYPTARPDAGTSCLFRWHSQVAQPPGPCSKAHRWWHDAAMSERRAVPLLIKCSAKSRLPKSSPQGVANIEPHSLSSSHPHVTGKISGKHLEFRCNRTCERCTQPRIRDTNPSNHSARG
jgi:hypothetical protein